MPQKSLAQLDRQHHHCESAQQMMQRMQGILQELVRLSQQHIALVAQGGSICAALAQLANASLAKP